MTTILTDVVLPITIIFLVIVAPLWIVMHYRAQARRSQEAEATSPEDQALMQRMVGLLEKMETRIDALERILDVEHPGIRDRRTAADRL